MFVFVVRELFQLLVLTNILLSLLAEKEFASNRY